MDQVSIGFAIAAIGALGTAAFGLVDAFKVLPNGGISHAGYPWIEASVQQFFPGQTRKAATGNVKLLFDTLHGNWINGRALADQKAIAKSLIKLCLSPQTSAEFAAVTGVDAKVLGDVAANMSNGTTLTTEQANVLGRFDLALAAILDDGYQHADQRYRNASKFLAMGIAVVLAMFGAWLTYAPDPRSNISLAEYLGRAFFAGLIATPLAPIAKDVASAVQAGAKVAQLVKR
jgi:hypothetical protein